MRGCECGGDCPSCGSCSGHMLDCPERHRVVRREPIEVNRTNAGAGQVVLREVTMRSVMDDVPAGGATAAVNAGHPAGDCLRACVASVLGLDLDDVPHFVQYVAHPAGTDEHLWWWALVGFCDAHGWRVNYVEEDDGPPRGWSLADGKSPRGHMHVVVTYDGEMVFDPHPSRAGLVSVQGWFSMEPKHPHCPTSLTGHPNGCRCRDTVEGGGPHEFDLSATALSADATPTTSADVGPEPVRATEGH